MFPILQVGGLALQVPGLLLLAGVWAAIGLAERQAARRDLAPAAVNTLILVGLVSGLVGARLGYVARFLAIYVESPLEILALQPSTLAAGEGVLVGCIGAALYARRRRLPAWRLLDVLAPGLAGFWIALGLADLASGAAFGALTEAAWGIELWGARRHPTQVYHLVGAAIGLMAVLRWRSTPAPDGTLFLLWAGWTALSRLVVEAWRGDSVLVLGGVREAQLVSLSVLLLAMALLRWRAASGASP
jgi:phosphatidylglycerol---prolipoprotein diacylglyceryl transferase